MPPSLLPLPVRTVLRSACLPLPHWYPVCLPLAQNSSQLAKTTPKLTKIDHPKRTISCKTLRFRAIPPHEKNSPKNYPLGLDSNHRRGLPCRRTRSASLPRRPSPHSDRFVQIRTNPNSLGPDSTRKDLKKAESPERAIPCKTLEIVPVSRCLRPGKSFAENLKPSSGKPKSLTNGQ